MPTTVTIAPQATHNAGTFGPSPGFSFPAGTKNVAIKALMNASDLTAVDANGNPVNTIPLILIELSTDNGATWQERARSGWESGPVRAGKTPTPPGEAIDTTDIAGAFKGRLTCTLGNTMSIGAQVTYY